MNGYEDTGRGTRRTAGLWAPWLCLVLLGGCDAELPWTGSGAETAASPADATPPSAFERRLLFITEPMDDSVHAAVIDYVVLHDSVRTRRTARILATGAEEWRSFLESTWDTEPVREPWRIIPNGRLRVLVDDSGEVEALIVDADSLRFLPGPTLAEHSPGPAARFQLRDAELWVDGARVRGLVLDLQLARPLDATAGGDVPAREPVTVDADADSVAAMEPPADGDVWVDALLTDGAGFRLVVDRSAEGSVVWLQHPQWQDMWTDARLVPSEYGLAQPAGRTVPILWHLVRAEGDTVAELRVSGRDYAAGTPGGGLYGVAVVRGWIELSGERRDLRGVLRHGSE